VNSFAEALRALMAERGISGNALARKIPCDKALISRYLTGRQQPSPRMARLVDDALGAGGELAELAARLPDRPGKDGALAAAGQLEPWEIADVLTQSPASTTAIDFMERATTGLAARYPYTPPAILAPEVQAMLRRIKAALSRSQPVSTRNRCVRLAGMLCGIAGQAADDMGQGARAAGYFDVGELAAAEIGHGDLAAWILAVRSIGVFFRGDYSAAMAMLGRARGAAEDSAPRRRAWLDALSAQATAAAAARARHAGTHEVIGYLDSASSHLDKAIGPPGGTDFFDRPRLTGIAGTALLLLRDTRGARGMLSDALASRSAADAKGRARLMLDLAECFAADGEPEEAARLGNDALSLSGAVVPSLLVRAREVSRALRRWEELQAVSDFGSHLTDISPRLGTEG
jgi:transcriptional regulator with XRE-family HTH domain